MKLIVGNFKMNLLKPEITEYINYFKDKKYTNVIFAPSYIYLNEFVDNGFTTCSQDVSFEVSGSYTGDVSAKELRSIGVTYSIIGHSERRKYYNDSNLVNEKLKRLLEEEINPIICIGETKKERDNHETFDVLKKELDEVLKNVDTKHINNVIIAYEPIWSIGTGVIPTNDEIHETIVMIKDYVFNKYDNKLLVLYGGSVNKNNILELEKIDGIDGYLVGGCSIKKADFDELINSVK